MKKSFLPLLTAAVMLLFIRNSTVAQNPSLVADVNATGNEPNVEEGNAVSNGILYFIGHTTVYGLWRSDGTQAGTHLVKNFTASDYYGISQLTDVNGTLFFAAHQDGDDFGTELWKSDGTAEGTVLVKDINPGSDGSDPGHLININGTLFFSAFTPEFGTELWKSDGTQTGTVFLKDITAGTDATYFGYEWTNYNGKLLFSRMSPDIHQQLWISDGTTSGTKMLRDWGYDPGGFGADFAQHFAQLNGDAFFSVHDEDLHNTLWKTNGTVNGTVLVKDFDPDNGPLGEQVAQICAVNEKLVINAYEGTYGSELWVSDGTTNGTQLLKDIYPGATSSYPKDLTAINGHVYFSANSPATGNEVWVTDGTTTGTQVFYELKPGPGTLFIAMNFTGLGNKIIFSDYQNGGFVYVTDGTADGTQDLSSVLTDEPYSDYNILTDFIVYNGKVYFLDSNNANFYLTDGTLGGSQEVQYTPSQTNSSKPTAMAKLSEGKYVFAANDGIHGNELWITDGTPQNTSLLKDINPGSDTTYIYFGPVVNGRLLFGAYDYDNGEYKSLSLWSTDGTTNGTMKIGGCAVASLNIGQFDYAILNGVAYFTAFVNNFGNSNTDTLRTLWRSNGTHAGTYPVANIFPNGSYITDLKTLNDAVYFNASDGISGVELWKTDGTGAGTVMVKDINAGVAGSNPSNLTVFNNALYFFADKGSSGEDLWRSDGTAAGTKKVAETSTPNSGSSSWLTASGNYLFFNSNGMFWRSDGTEEGTIELGAMGFNLVDVNGTVFYFANDGTNGYSVWKSDGSVTGTVPVKSMGLGIVCCVSHPRSVNNNLYFILSPNGNTSDKELWRSDGSACRTIQLDLVPDVADIADILLTDDNLIFLSLNSEAYGIEPFKYTTSPIADHEVCNGIDDDCNGVTDDNPEASIIPAGTISVCVGALVTLTANEGYDLTYQWQHNGQPIAGATNQTFNTKQPGSFSVTVTRTGGCTATSDETTIHRAPKPTANIAALGSLDICAAGSVFLHANTGTQYNYQWYLNNQLLAGATGQTYEATMIGNYKVLVTNAGGCSKMSGITEVYSSCKVTEQGNVSSGEIELYPNPASGILNIICPGLFEKDELPNATLVITNLLGQIIFTQQITSSQTIINISSWIPGTYLVQVRTSSRIEKSKFIKQ